VTAILEGCIFPKAGIGTDLIATRDRDWDLATFNTTNGGVCTITLYIFNQFKVAKYCARRTTCFSGA